MVHLDALVARLGGRCELAGLPVPDVGDVHLDSRSVAPGSLFAALPGERFDGAEFAGQAVLRGAVCVLAPRQLDLSPGAVAWVHADARRVAGEAASIVHGEPSSRLDVLAVTGTNGKTTVAWLAAQLLERAGRRPALLGTVEYRVAGAPPLPAKHTTPEATDLHRLLARHLAGGGDSVVLEASSHALAQDRLAGLAVDVAIFTNLTRDHLDYHRDMQRYADAKARLFETLSPAGTAVLNAGDPASRRMQAAAEGSGARAVTYSIGSRADLSASSLRVTDGGVHLVLQGMGISKAELFIPLVGRHNVENALAACAAVLVSGASPFDVIEGLANVTSAPGRLERVPVPGRDLTCLVDYAHTGDALERVLEVCRQSLESRAQEQLGRGAPAGGSGIPAGGSGIPAGVSRCGRLIAVFGCGGSRDSGKRAPMGAAANRIADVAIVTSDNPREEDPGEIIEQVLAGMQPPRAELHVEPDRRAAIHLAAELARPGDLVLIAGKGHERVQILRGGRQVPFDDRAVAAEAFA